MKKTGGDYDQEVRKSGRAEDQKRAWEDHWSACFIGCSKMARCKAPESPRTEAYVVYAAGTRGEGNAADGHFSTADQVMTNLRM
jgi:hypothetical protein